MSGLLPGPWEVQKKIFVKKDPAEEARLGAVCNIHNQGRQVGHGVLVYDQHVNVNDSPDTLSKYCIITSTKVIEIENFNNDSTYQVVFSKKSKTFNLQQITKSIKETDSGLVIIFVDPCHQDFQHAYAIGKKTCSILRESPLTIADCDQLQQLFCYVANKCCTVKSGDEDGVYILKATSNNSGTSSESTNVPEEIQNGTVVLQRTENDNVTAVGVFNVVDKTKMVISPIWLKSSIKGILEDSSSHTSDQPEPAPTNGQQRTDGPPPAPDSAAAAASSTTDQPQTLSVSTNGQAPSSPVPNVESPPLPRNQVPAAGSDTADAPDSAAAAASSTTDQPQTLSVSTNGQAPASPVPNVESPPPPRNQVPAAGSDTADVADQLVSKAVTDNEVLLDKLSKYLDRERRIIKCWKHLACVLNVPGEEREKFDMYTEHSPTEEMFNYLANHLNPDLKVKELKAKLAEIHRNDVIRLLTEGGYLDEKRVSDFVSSQSSDGNFIDMLSSRLDSKKFNNWKSLATKFGIPKSVTDQFGVRGPGPAAALFSHMRTVNKLRDLTVEQLRGHFEAMERNDLLKVLMEHGCKDSSLVREVAKAESPLLEDIVKRLNRETGGVKNWRHLAYRLGIPSEVYDAFDTSKGDAQSPTEMMFKWLMLGKPELRMKDLLDGLKIIDRFDVVEFVTAEAVLDFHFRQLREIRLFPDQAAKEGTGEPLADLREKAAARKFRIVNNDGQGNCMFSALSHQLQIKKGVKKSARQLRTELVQYVKNHPTLEYANGSSTHLSKFVNSEEYPTWLCYLEEMAKDGTWGEDVMITVAARHLNCAIRIISNRPDFEDILLKPDPTISDGVQLVELVLGHIVDFHYVSLEPEH